MERNKEGVTDASQMLSSIKNENVSVWSRRLSSFIVVVTCFLCAALSSGAANSLSVLIVELLKYFRQSKFATSWCSALCVTLGVLSAPIGPLLLRRMSHRMILRIGIIVSTVGLFLSAFATNLVHLYFTLGILTGVGYGLLDYPSTVFASEYFTTKRNMVMGIVSTGAGVGFMLVNLMMNVLIAKYTWRGSLILLAGINVQLLVFTFIVKKLKNQESPSITIDNDISTLTHEQRQIVSYNNLDIRDQEYNDKIEILELSLPDKYMRLDKDQELTVEHEDYEKHSAKANLLFLCRSWQFYMFCLNQTLSYVAITIFLTFNFDYFLSVGMIRTKAILLVSLVGIGNISGRITSAVLAQCFKQRMTIILLVADAAIAVSTILLTRYTDFYIYAVLSFMIGGFYGLISSCNSLVTVELFGVSRIREALAIALLALGIGALSGPPFGGFVFDVTHDYRDVFYMCTGVYVVATTCIVSIVGAPLFHTMTNRNIERNRTH